MSFEEGKMNLQTILGQFYDYETNVQVSSFWDGGWTIKIGDEMNGFKESKNFDTLEEGTTWLYSKFNEKFGPVK